MSCASPRNANDIRDRLITTVKAKSFYMTYLLHNCVFGEKERKSLLVFAILARAHREV